MGEKGIHGKIYCLGSGCVRPLREYIEEIRNNIDAKQELKFGEVAYGANQVMYLCADISELTQDTGFNPQYNFEKGIKEMIEWCKADLNLGDKIS